MTTARCYACHSLRPIYEFPYRRKDTAITPSSRMKRYIGVLLQKPGASTFDRRGSGGVIYRYRCIHPRAGRCPQVMAPEGSPAIVPAQEEVRVEGEECSGSDRRRSLEARRRDEVGRDEVEIEVAVDERVEQDEFRRQKEETLKELRQCVDAAETTT